MDLLQIRALAAGCSITALSWGLACTMDNPAFDAYLADDDETRGEETKGEETKGEETAGSSATGDGDGDGDPTTGDGDGDGDGDGESSTGDGDGEPTTGDGDGDGEPNPIDPCAAILDPGSCAMAPGCIPLWYDWLHSNGAEFCLAEGVFDSCISAADCVPPDGNGYEVYCSEQLNIWIGVEGCLPLDYIDSNDLESCNVGQPPAPCPP